VVKVDRGLLVVTKAEIRNHGMQKSQGNPSGLFFRSSWFRLLAGRADVHHGLLGGTDE
jgi:hypothetical protein